MSFGETERANTGRTFGGRGRGFLPADNKSGRGGDGGENGFGGRRNGGGDGDGERKSFGGGRRNFGGDDEEGGQRGFGGRKNFGRDGEDGGGDRGFGGGRKNFGGDGEDGGGRSFGGGRRNFGGDSEDGGGRGFGGGRKNFGDGENGGEGGFRRNNSGGDNDGGQRGGRRNFGGDDQEGGEGGFRKKNFGGDDEGGQRGGRKNFGGEDGENGGDGEEAPKRQTYVPPAPTEDDDELYGSGISSGINFSKYNDIPVKVSGDDVPKPIASFEQAGLRPFIQDLVAKCGYKVPTPVQKYALPCILAGRDVMGCAQTGSGKTAAFLLPIIQNLLTNPESSDVDGNSVAPQALIITPTRELTIQIWEETRKFIRGSSVQAVTLYGGTQVYHQLEQLFKGANIIVATPGRLNDFVTRGKVVFDRIRFVVLDEADRMLDMGFKPDIEKVMSHPTMVPKTERQTLMFSATFPESIQRMSGAFLNNYLFIAVGQVGGACADVQQRVLMVKRKEKKDKMLEILGETGGDKTVIFVETKRQADYISVVLSEQQLPATSIHGDREQRQREEAIMDFKRGKMSILVATAVASRGLDIKDVRHVINYDMPKEIDEYVHRIGRTGRLGNQGLATSFFDDEKDMDLAPALVRILSQAGQEVPDFLTNTGGGYGGGNDDFGGSDFRGGNDAPVSSNVVESEEW